MMTALASAASPPSHSRLVRQRLARMRRLIAERSAMRAGRASGVAGSPVLTVALDDGGDVLGADAIKVQVKAAGKFTPGCSG
jgi:hypothetical protein